MLTLRAWTTERDGQIHCDSTAKRVTVLLYLNPAAMPGASTKAACACCAVRATWRTTPSKCRR